MIAWLPWAFVLAGLAGLALWLLFRRYRGLDAVERNIRKLFPEVHQLSAAALGRRLVAGERPLLLDVRQPEEFAVSHLPGAVRIDPDDPAPDLGPEVGPETPIVVYCAVGGRSSRMARRLMRLGYRQVSNLEGSIFRWAMLGLPLVQGATPVQKVHPTGPGGALLIPPALRAQHPAEALAVAGPACGGPAGAE